MPRGHEGTKSKGVKARKSLTRLSEEHRLSAVFAEPQSRNPRQHDDWYSVTTMDYLWPTEPWNICCLRDEYADLLATCRLQRFKSMVWQLSWARGFHANNGQDPYSRESVWRLLGAVIELYMYSTVPDGCGWARRHRSFNARIGSICGFQLAGGWKSWAGGRKQD